MTVPADTAVSLAELFDRHASLVIDADTYQTNPQLREVADRIMGHAGLTAQDVAKDGLTVYRTYAVLTVWDNTPDGKPIIRGGSRVKRIVTVDLP